MKKTLPFVLVGWEVYGGGTCCAAASAFFFGFAAGANVPDSVRSAECALRMRSGVQYRCTVALPCATAFGLQAWTPERPGRK